MEKLICSSCGAAITPNTTQPILTCEYCDTSIPNAYYVESDAKAAAEPTLQELCIQTLIEMGENENLADVDANCFGNPIHSADTARAGMGIPDREKLYFLYDHLSLLGTVKEGFALTDGGLYFKCDGDEGSRSWEAFITGSIACEDRVSWQEAGTLAIGTSLKFSISSDADSRLAKFLIDFHNHVYHQYTGQIAPEAWSVVENGTTAQVAEAPSLADTVLSAARTLLGRAAVQRTITTQRPVVLRTAKKTVAQKYHTRHVEPPRPARPVAPQPMRQPRMERPMSGSRSMGGPGGRGGMGGPGGRGGRGGPGGMGGPGRGRR